MELGSQEMQEITTAIQMADKGESRALMLALWERHAPAGDPVPLCTLAHYLADTEPDPAAELEWDLRSLHAATGGRDAEDRDPVTPTLTMFLPSIHLSVAEGYRKAGDLERARAHVSAAANRVGVLGEDGYGALIRGGLRRLQGLVGG